MRLCSMSRENTARRGGKVGKLPDQQHDLPLWFPADLLTTFVRSSEGPFNGLFAVVRSLLLQSNVMQNPGFIQPWTGIGRSTVWCTWFFPDTVLLMCAQYDFH